MKEIATPEGLTAQQLELLGKLADKVVSLGVATPAVLFLESFRPMNFVGSQAMLFFAPMLRSWFTLRDYDLLQKALERRATLGYLADLIEAKDEAAQTRIRELRAQQEAAKRAAREAKRKR